MPRDSGGTVTLPGGTFVTGTVISSTIMNQKFADLTSMMTDSLSRTGLGGMLAPLEVPDGSAALPSLTWGNDPGTGFWLPELGMVRLTSSAATLQQWTTTGVTIYPATTVDDALTVTGATTLQDDLIVNGSTTLSGPTTAEATITGDVGGEDFAAKPGSVDHAYVAFYARTATPTTRTGYVGYGGAGFTALTVANLITSADISLIPGTGGKVTSTGNLEITASAPTSSTAFANTVTRSNVVKAHAKVTTGAGTVTLNGGFNLTAAINGNNIRLTFPSGGAMSNANYTVAVSDNLSPKYKTTVTSQQTTHLDLSLTELQVVSGPALTEVQVAFGSIVSTVFVTVTGPQ